MLLQSSLKKGLRAKCTEAFSYPEDVGVRGKVCQGIQRVKSYSFPVSFLFMKSRFSTAASFLIIVFDQMRPRAYGTITLVIWTVEETAGSMETCTETKEPQTRPVHPAKILRQKYRSASARAPLMRLDTIVRRLQNDFPFAGPFVSAAIQAELVSSRSLFREIGSV